LFHPHVGKFGDAEVVKQIRTAGVMEDIRVIDYFSGQAFFSPTSIGILPETVFQVAWLVGRLKFHGGAETFPIIHVS
jgi:hypothetical protein